MNKLKEKYIKLFVRYIKENNLYDNIEYKNLLIFNKKCQTMPYDYMFTSCKKIKHDWNICILSELSEDIYSILEDIIDDGMYLSITEEHLITLKQKIKNSIKKFRFEELMESIDLLGIGYKENLMNDYNTYPIIFYNSNTLKYLTYQFTHE